MKMLNHDKNIKDSFKKKKEEVKYQKYILGSAN